MSDSKEVKEKIYCIYMHTSPSGKSYIGQTSNYKKRNTAHKNSKGCSAFKDAIDKYGWDNFIHEILLDGLTIEEANYWEDFCIREFNTFGKNGYNLQSGGLNYITSEETKIKLSELRKLEWENRTEEEKIIWAEKQIATKKAKSDEEKQDIINRTVATMMSKSPEERRAIKQKELDTRASKSEEEKQISKDRYKDSFYSKSEEELNLIFKKRSETLKNRSEEEKKSSLDKRIATVRMKKYGTLDEDVITKLQNKRKAETAKKYRLDNKERYTEYERGRVRIYTDEQKKVTSEKRKQYRIENKERLNARERELYAEKQRIKKLNQLEN